MFKPKCEICGKELSGKAGEGYVIVEEAKVCNNPDCIKEEEKRVWESHKGI